jgi:CBS domain-containing protein
MGAILAGTMRAPLTAVMFALELTGDLNLLLPLLVAATAAHGFTVLALKRSILTEKLARRGFHVSREYAIDALEILFVREVMRTGVAALPAGATLGEVAAASAVLAFADEPLRVAVHRMADTGLTCLPVVDRSGRDRLLPGCVSLHDVLKARLRHLEEERRRERASPLELLIPFARFALDRSKGLPVLPPTGAGAPDRRAPPPAESGG